MFYIALGAFSFVLGYLHDLADLRNRTFFKRVLGFAAFFLFVFSLARLSVDSPELVLPYVLPLVAWPFFGVFTLLFIYSVFFEIHFSTAIPNSKEKKLVTTGTYALSRHPTFLWSVLAMGCLVLATKSQYLLMAWPLWTTLELIWVWLQDRFFLPSMFANYEQYRQHTPMLMPTAQSIRECVASLGGVPIPKMTKGGKS